MSDAPREMAAVMFTDVRGYSSLSQRDEALALRLLQIMRDVADPLIANHHGRLVKTIGDALMVEFKSALAAAQCATELQKNLHEHNQTVPDAEHLLVRIGIHVGDVVRKDGDLFGDTVNIAARVEPQAIAGGIALTQTVFEQIRSKFAYTLLPLGDQKLKGIEEGVALYAVKLPWQSYEFTAASGPRPGLAARLKQHHMFRVASWYATAAYVLILVANAVFPDIGLTRGDVRYLIAGLALGFPVVLTLSWIFIPPSRENPEHFSRWRRVRWRLGAAVSLLVIAFVTVSGTYLWHVNERLISTPAATEEAVSSAQSQSIAILPFDKLGTVDDQLINGLQATIETTLSNLGSVRLVPHSAFPTPSGHKPSLTEIAKTTGATLVLQGSIQQVADKGPYTLQMDLISSQDAETLYSATVTYAGKAQLTDIEQQTASNIAGPVRFLTQGDDWLAQGYPTTKNPRAMELLRKALMAEYYEGTGTPTQLLHAALALDPNFAQAHAYLALDQSTADDTGKPIKDVDDQIATAEKLVPGLPEAALARASEQIGLGNYQVAEKMSTALLKTLPNNFWVHWIRALGLNLEGKWDDALSEYKQTAILDPYQMRTSALVAQLGFAKRDYEDTDEFLAELQTRWPLYPSIPLWRAHLAFAWHGDVAKLAKVVDSDWSAYEVTTLGAPTLAHRIEVAHLLSKHAEVMSDLKSFPYECLSGSLFGSLIHRLICTDSFTAESLRLMGQEREASNWARLHLPQDVRQDDRYPNQKAVHTALLQAFGGNAQDAMRTIEPLLSRLQKPTVQWTRDDAWYSEDVAVVLAWSGEQQQAIAVLADSLNVTYGAQAAVIAVDPIWRPLYKDSAFVALLAAHGQQLEYTH